MTLKPLETKHASLFMVTEAGERSEIATETFFGLSDDEITRTMIDSHWDQRLTCASCSPYVVIEKKNHV